MSCMSHWLTMCSKEKVRFQTDSFSRLIGATRRWYRSLPRMVKVWDVLYAFCTTGTSSIWYTSTCLILEKWFWKNWNLGWHNYSWTIPSNLVDKTWVVTKYSAVQFEGHDVALPWNSRAHAQQSITLLLLAVVTIFYTHYKEGLKLSHGDDSRDSLIQINASSANGVLRVYSTLLPFIRGVRTSNKNSVIQKAINPQYANRSFIILVL